MELYPKAVQHLERSIEINKEKESKKIEKLIDEKYWSSLYHLGTAYEKMGKGKEALQKYIQTCSQTHSSYCAFWSYGVQGYYTYMANRRANGLKKKYYPEHLKYKSPDDITKMTEQEKKEMSDKFLLIGRKLHRKHGLYDNAMECFDIALKLNPNNSMVLKEKGVIYSRSGQELESLKITLKALEMDPLNLMAMHNVSCQYDDYYNTGLVEIYRKRILEKYKEMLKNNITTIKKKYPWATLWGCCNLLDAYLENHRTSEAIDLVKWIEKIKLSHEKYLPSSLPEILIAPLIKIHPDENLADELIKTPNDKFYQTIGREIQFTVNLLLSSMKSQKRLKINKWSFDYDFNRRNISLNFSITENNKKKSGCDISSDESVLYKQIYKNIFSHLPELISYNDKESDTFDNDIKKVIEKGILPDINDLFPNIRKQINILHDQGPSSIQIFALARNIFFYALMLSPLDEEITYPYLIRSYTLFELLKRKYPKNDLISVFQN